MADPSVWAEIGRLYCESDETIHSIAQRFGVTDRLIFKEARRQGWPRRSERRRQRVGVTGPIAPVPPSDPIRVAREALVRRLFRVMNKRLEKLEKRMQTEDDTSPDDIERDRREIDTMVRGLDKLTEAAADRKRPPEAGSGKPTLLTSAEAERLRNEIAERLERLYAGGAAPKGPDGAK